MFEVRLPPENPLQITDFVDTTAGIIRLRNMEPSRLDEIERALHHDDPTFAAKQTALAPLVGQRSPAVPPLVEYPWLVLAIGGFPLKDFQRWSDVRTERRVGGTPRHGSSLRRAAAGPRRATWKGIIALLAVGNLRRVETQPERDCGSQNTDDACRSLDLSSGQPCRVSSWCAGGRW